jgi:hypothetical protein
MKKMIDALAEGTYQSPETIAGETLYDVNNGVMASLFTHDTMQNLFDAMKVKNDGLLDKDDNDETWTTSVAVYDDTTEDCNPNGLVPVVGFASLTITDVSPPPESTIYATVVCELIDSGRGGGGNYGTMGSIPGLVQ